jgi:phenylalanyl-tRNA synthetase beta chain
VRLANPLSDEQPLMRTRLLATMVDALRRNVARGTRDVGLFELGLVVALDGPRRPAPTEDVGIHPSEETLAAIRAAVPPQPRHVGLLLAGDRERAGWWGPGRPAEVADVVELARTVGEALGLVLEVSADAVAPFHPGRCARVTLPDGTTVGHVGELHPKVVAALGLPARTVAGELDLEVLTVASEATVQARTLTTFPMAQSDVAVVVDEAVPADAVQRSLRRGAGEHLEALTLFDVYRGNQVGDGRKSLAYRLTFRAPDRTLTTDEVSALRDAALRTAAETVGAVQRG